MLGGAFAALPKTEVSAATSSDFDCTYSIGDKNDSFNCSLYLCQEIRLYTADEAAAAGIPAGYSGDVISVISSSVNRGVTLDFSDEKIPVSLVESITFRVYVGDDGKDDAYPEVRIPLPGKSGSEWAMRYDISKNTDKWQDIVLSVDAGTFYVNAGNRGFECLSLDGYLHKFELGMRHNGPTGIFYIDSVHVNLIENDGVAPTLVYNGEDVVTISAGQTLNFDVSATDEMDGKVDVQYIWGDPSKLDANGQPTVGTHTLIFRAEDVFGNKTEKTITVIVEAPDLVAPTIEIPAKTIYAKTGTYPRISVTATDDKGDVASITYVWSAGAFDARGRLVDGTHTLTITATDFSGNETKETITFIVTADGGSADVIVDEDLLGKEEPDDSLPEESVPEESEPTESLPEESFPEESVTESMPTEETKSGCASAIGGVGIFSLLTLAGVCLLKKRK